MYYIEKFARWYLHKFCNETFYTLVDMSPALLKAKEKEGARLKLIFDAEKDELDHIHKKDIMLVKAEAEAEITRMSNEMAIMIKKVKNAQEVYYETTRKAKITDSVVSDMTTQLDNVNKMMASIYGCMEGIKKRANDHIKSLATTEENDRDRLSMPRSVTSQK